MRLDELEELDELELEDMLDELDDELIDEEETLEFPQEIKAINAEILKIRMVFALFFIFYSPVTPALSRLVTNSLCISKNMRMRGNIVSMVPAI